jgi:TatD DNase family protein
MKYIDIHCHPNFPEYDEDREKVIEEAKKLGVGMIAVGTDMMISKSCIDLAYSHNDIWATVGTHPTHDDAHIDFESLRKLAMDPKVVAIGECGLDFFHCEPSDYSRQEKVFIEHIKIANEVNKPLMLHVRNPKKGGDAYMKALELLKLHAKVKANFHFFAGNKEDLAKIIEAGHSVSFTGVLTFTSDYDDLVRMVPIDRLMSETDAPFATPVPYRGKRNNPVYVINVVEAIARIRGVETHIMAEQLLSNARNFFGL